MTSDDDKPVPGYKNYLVYCDESGHSGKTHYGFGSLWMPWERRGDFTGLVNQLREEHNFHHEIKWNKTARHNEGIVRALVEEFFRRNWLMFHCIIVRRGYVDRKHHRDGYDEAMRKHFAMLLSKKIAFFSRENRRKKYHINVDPLPSHYKKADEAAHVIINNELKRDLGYAPVHTFTTRDSKTTPGIQLADLLLGAIMSDWNQEDLGDVKSRVRDWIAEHLGWRSLNADTRHWEWKFNIWQFFDPTSGGMREHQSWAVNWKYPVQPYRPRRRRQ
jgi:hypothetical protein